MALFNHKIKLTEILREIPEAELVRLAKKSHVDHYAKVLDGKLMFYLLLYGMLKVDRLSQRGLQDAFRSPVFRTIFNYHGKKEISHSSISERLASINVEFFEKAYEAMYQRFSSLYTSREIESFFNTSFLLSWYTNLRCSGIFSTVISISSCVSLPISSSSGLYVSIPVPAASCDSLISLCFRKLRAAFRATVCIYALKDLDRPIV